MDKQKKTYLSTNIIKILCISPALQKKDPCWSYVFNIVKIFLEFLQTSLYEPMKLPENTFFNLLQVFGNSNGVISLPAKKKWCDIINRCKGY